MVNTSMTHEFKHPKYYKELRDAGTELAKRNAVKQHLDLYPGSSPVRNKSDQAISKPDNLEVVDSVRPGPGLKLQATSYKLQATSFKLQATSNKLQALGEAASSKR